MNDFARKREQMVEELLVTRGIRDQLVLDAMGSVPRELFVAKADQVHAYKDCPLPIGSGQTISQPFIVAYMIEAMELRGGENVLEVGGGCGYAAAVLGEIAEKVTAIEFLESLVQIARENLKIAKISNVELIHGDGNLGWPENAPYDAILVSAAADDIPEKLVEQLKEGGRMVIPVGDPRLVQRLMLVTRNPSGEIETETLTEVRFVPLVKGSE